MTTSAASSTSSARSCHRVGRLDRAAPRRPPPQRHRADRLAATRHGRGKAAAPRGVDASASLKEEFGIAILEAMAAGLVVVAPGTGGPATYVTSGESGVLADTASAEALAAACSGTRPGRVAAGRLDRGKHDGRGARPLRRRQDGRHAGRGLQQVAAGRRTARPGAGRRDAARHQPGLRLPPLSPRDAGDGVAAAGERVVVATGRRRPRSGRLRLRARRPAAGARLQPWGHPCRGAAKGEDDSLRGFFDATRRGAVETLAFQARGASDDLLWDPVDGGPRRAAHRRRRAPGPRIVDHLAFSARLALVGAGVHSCRRRARPPVRLPHGRRRGVRLPAGLPDSHRARWAMRSHYLHRLCIDVRDSFTAQWNRSTRHAGAGCCVERRCLRRDG